MSSKERKNEKVESAYQVGCLSGLAVLQVTSIGNVLSPHNPVLRDARRLHTNTRPPRLRPKACNVATDISEKCPHHTT